MGEYNLVGEYERAIQHLSELVQQRNNCLMELERLATLPLSISPRTGHVAEFDLEAARELLDSIAQQTRRIQQAMEAVNRAGAQSGRLPVEWLRMPEAGE